MRSRRRRGGILPLVAVLMVAVALCAGLVVDMSRAYAQKNELQTAADAAALSGVIELFRDTTGVAGAAWYYSGLNTVLHQSIADANTDVICGFWSDGTQTFTPAEYCGAQHDAVSFNARDTATFTFPLLLGMAKKEVSVSATAWMGFVQATTCVKPWSMPYRRLTRVLDPGWPDVKACEDAGGTDCDDYLLRDPDRILDDVDQQALRDRPVDLLTFSLKSPDNVDDPGSYGIIDVGGGKSQYEENIAGCTDKVIGRDSVVSVLTGMATGPTLSGVEDLCPGYKLSRPECRNAAGTLGVPIIAALWDYASDKCTGTSCSITIRQLVSFSLDYVAHRPHTVINGKTYGQGDIVGHFIPGVANGLVGEYPTTIRRPILVE